MKIFLKGLNSCAMRKAELEHYRNFLVKNGHQIVDDPAEAQMVFIWTCGFRGDVRDSSIAEIERYQKEFGAKLVVGGCLPDIEPALLKKHFHGPVVRWKEDKKKMTEVFGAPRASFEQTAGVFFEENLCDDVQKYRKEHPDKDATFHDQFLKLLVSEGCNFECSYCSERLAFPPYRSFTQEELSESCKAMVEKTGVYRVILLADSLGDYGCDIGTDLPSLLRTLKKAVPGLKFALNNLNPGSFVKFYDELAGFLKAGDILHLNLPIQSASAKVLQAMNRPYTRPDMDKVFGLLLESDFREFDTHIIVGFPGETEEDFRETVDFILKHKPKYVLASAFMEAPGMEASRLAGKIPDEVKRQRLAAAAAHFKAAGIICNTDDSELSRDRQRRLSKV